MSDKESYFMSDLTVSSEKDHFASMHCFENGEKAVSLFFQRKKFRSTPFILGNRI